MEFILLSILPAFVWLLYETDFLRVRLPVGEAIQSNSKGIKTETNTTALIEFKAILCKHGKSNYGDNLKTDNKAYELPARTIIYKNYTLNFPSNNCNICRANMIREVVKVNNDKFRKSNINHPLGVAQFPLNGYNPKTRYFEPTIDISVNGNTLSLNGDYKKGKIKDFMKANKS